MKMKEISIALMEIFESVEMMEQLLSKISTEEKKKKNTCSHFPPIRMNRLFDSVKYLVVS